MKILTMRKKTRAVFAMALMLGFLAFAHVGVLFAAAPTVTTGSASSVTKTSATIAGTINNDGGSVITSAGLEYGLTTSYGGTYSTTPTYNDDYELDFSFGTTGSGNGQFDVVAGVDTDSAGNIYVGDAGNHRIQKFDSAGTYITQWGSAGTGNGQFGNSQLLLGVDSSDNIYVVDSGLNRVQKFDSSGVYQSQFGTTGAGNGQFNTPIGIAFDSVGSIYVGDSGNHRVQKFNSSGVYQSQFGTFGTGNGQFQGASSIFIDSSDNIFVLDLDHVQKFDSSGNYQSQFSVASPDTPFGFTGDSLGNFYLTEFFTNGGIFEYNSAGTYQGNFGGVDFDTSLQISVDTSDNIFVAANNNTLILKYSPVQNLASTSISTSISSLTCNTTYHYRAYATNADGTSYGNDATFTTSACDVPVVETGNAARIGKKAATLTAHQSSDGVGASTVRGFEYGTSASSYSATVTFSGATALAESSIGTGGSGDAEFIGANGIARDDAGNLYVADTQNHRVQILDSTGALIRMFGWGVTTGGSSFEVCTSGCQAGLQGSGAGQFDSPEGIALDTGTGNIYVSDTANNRIQVFTSAGTYLPPAIGSSGSGSGQFNAPKGIVVINNSIHVVDSGNNRVQKLTLAGTMLDEIGSAFMNGPTAIAGETETLYVADTSNNKIYAIDRGTMDATEVTFIEPAGWPGMNFPMGIAIDDDHNLYISDQGISEVLFAVRESDQYHYRFIETHAASVPGQLVVGTDRILRITDPGSSVVVVESPFFSKELKPLECGTTYYYRAFATNSDGTGYGDEKTFSTSSNCGSSTGGGGGGGDPAGCIDPTASNYDSGAVVDDGSCYYNGCTDPGASNYNVNASMEDGSCIFVGTPVPGCMNPLATNYNAAATVDDGTCNIPGGGGPDDTYGCTDSFADNYESTADIDDGSCEYTLPPGTVVGCTDNDALNYNANATSDDGSCTYEPPTIWPPIREIIDIITEVTGWTPEEQADIYKPVAVAGLVVPSIWLLLANRSALVSIPLRLWNLIPTLLGFRRKRRPWGTVYDSVTKQPLDPVYVRLYDQAYAEVATSITDLDGRYGFAPAPGAYTIDAKKGDYVFPSAKLKDMTRDELYDDLYFGEKLEIEQEDAIITKNIPMDAINFNWNEFEKGKRAGIMKFYSKGELFLSRIAKILFIAGFASSILLAAIEPRTFNFIILGIYVAIFILSLFGVRPRQPGYVVERGTGVPLSFGILSVFSAALGQEVGHTIVGATGRYHILVPKGRYFVKLRKKTGEQTYEEVYTSDVFKARNGYIDKVIKI